MNPIAREFRGVPYAAPPVGALRWAQTAPVAAWAPATLPATADAAGCMQHCHEPPHACPAVISEDCLYLNIFTPRAAALNASGPVPVLLFIHGGACVRACVHGREGGRV